MQPAGPVRVLHRLGRRRTAVACVTPIRRVARREVTTIEGLSDERRARWSEAFVAHGASQCGFCTPGIVMRLAALEGSSSAKRSPTELRRDVEAGLRAHLCRCTGWQSIVDAAAAALGPPGIAGSQITGGDGGKVRDQLLAAWRAQLEGPTFQSSGPEVVLGGGGFADDTAPPDALLQLGADAPLARGIREARAESGRVQGRNSTVPLSHPVVPPAGEWALTLATTWVEPAYVEPDASWCRPGDQPASPLSNGGAFGGKRRSPAPARARALADERADTVRGAVAARRRGAARPQASAPWHRTTLPTAAGSCGSVGPRARRIWRPWPSTCNVSPRAFGSSRSTSWALRSGPSCAAPVGPRCWRRCTRSTRRWPVRKWRPGRGEPT